MNLVLLPDLIRQAPAFPDGFFDLIREPIRQGCGVDIGVAPRDDKVGGLQEGFDAAHFRKLALGPPAPHRRPGRNKASKLTTWRK